MINRLHTVLFAVIAAAIFTVPAFADNFFDRKTTELLALTGFEKNAPVKISQDADGIISILDKGTFFYQHTIEEPNVSSAPNLIIDPNLKIPSSCDKLVIVTHGWIDKAANDWPADTVRAIYSKVDHSEWICGYLDWRGGAFVINPTDAAEYARDIAGPRLAKTILKLGRFKHIHLIAHSAGSWAINIAAKLIIQKSPATKIHLTFLDAYVPIYWQQAELAATCIWADHYYNRDITGSTTEVNLSNAHNIDVTDIEPVLKDHKFLFRWYYATIAGKFRPCDNKAGSKVFTYCNNLDYGFARSLEAGEDNWEKSLTLAKGNVALKIENPDKKTFLDFLLLRR
jgi:hypothetical protein